MTRRAFIAAAGALGACAPRRDDGRLRFWAMGYEGDYSPGLMPAFTRATGIEVEVQSLPWTAAHEKLLTAFAGGTLPDVMMLPNGWVTEFAMIGAIAPLPDPALAADLLDGVADSVTHHGRLYAVPWSLSPQMQFYRRDLLAQAGYDAPPEDWAGWIAMGERLRARRPGDYAFLLYLNWWDALFTFAGQGGTIPLRDRDTRGDFASPAFRDALGFYKSLFDRGLAPRALSTQLQDPFGAFAQGLFAVYPSAPWLLVDLHRRAAELPRERWGVARMPGPAGPGRASAVSGAVAVAATTRRPDAAWALVRHLTSPASELRFQRMIGNLPPRRDVWASPQLDRPLYAPFAAQVRALAPDPRIVEWERIRLEAQFVAERVVRGDLSIDAGVAEIDRRVDRLLARRRALVEAGRLT